MKKPLLHQLDISKIAVIKTFRYKYSMILIRFFSVLILLVLISSCSSTESKKEEALPAQAQPSPQKKPEEPFWRCTILNGEGRTFTAQDSTSFAAEGKAKRECQMNYRHCTLLKCDHVTE